MTIVRLAYQHPLFARTIDRHDPNEDPDWFELVHAIIVGRVRRRR